MLDLHQSQRGLSNESRLRGVDPSFMGNNSTTRAKTVRVVKDENTIDKLITTLREGQFSQGEFSRKRKAKVVESVQVHVIKLEDLPEPLSMREFREICLRQGLPIETYEVTSNPGTASGDFFRQQREMQRKREQQRWNNMVSNIFGAYLAIFDLFKKWHSGIIQQRHFGPENVEEHLLSQSPKPPFMSPIHSNLSPKEMLHVKQQQMLVQLLLQYGIGGEGTTTASSKRGTSGGPARETQSISRKFKIEPLQSEDDVYDMLDEPTQPKPKTAQATYARQLMPVRLSVPGHKNNNIKVSENQIRKYSFAVSDDESEEQELSSRNHSARDVHVDLDVQIIDKDDYEYFDPQDEVQVAKNAVERLRILTGTPDDHLFTSKNTGRASKSQIRFEQSRIYDNQEEQAGGLTEKDLNNETEFYSPMHKRLRKELIETRKKLAETKMLLEASEKRNIAIVSKYNKEEVDRTVHSKILSLPYPEQAEILRNQIESKFYNAVDGLEPAVVEILNQKLSTVKEFFMSQIRLIQHHTDEFREKVDLMETMHKDGIKFSDMDTEKLIERIGLIEDLRRESKAKLRQIDPSSRTKANMNRPQQIWNMLMQHFGSDYFLEVIEEEYGIAPGANEYFSRQIQDHFTHEMEQHKRQVKQQEDEFVETNMALQQEIQALTEKNAELMRHDEKRLEHMVLEHRANMNMLYKTNEENLVKNYKAKLQDANETIQEMIRQRDTQYRSQKSMQQMYAWKRWQMFATIKRLIVSIEETNKTGIDYKVQKLCERFIDEEHLILRYAQDNNVPVATARHQMFQDKIFELKNKKSYYKNEYHTNKNRAEEARARIEDYRTQIETLTQKNTELMVRLPALEAQNKKYESILVLKEMENQKLNEDIKTIEKRWKNNTKEAYKFTAKPILAALKLKSLNEMGSLLIRMTNAQRRIHANCQTKGTITDINGIRKRIDEVKLIEKNNIHSVEAQTEETVTLDAYVMAVPIMFDAQVGPMNEGKPRSIAIQTEKVSIAKSRQMIEKQATCDSIFLEKSQAQLEKPKRSDIGRASFARPKLADQKSKSIILPKEYMFHTSNARVVNHHMSSKVAEKEEKTSQQDSDQKYKLRRGGTFKLTKNQQSAISNDKILIQKPTGGVKNCTENGEGSQDGSRDRSSQMLKKAPTVDSFMGSDVNLQKSSSHYPLMERTSKNIKRNMRQTITGGADTQSKGSSQDLGTRRFMQKNKDLEQVVTQRKNSPLKQGNATSKSQEKFEAGSQAQNQKSVPKKLKSQQLTCPITKKKEAPRQNSALKQRTRGGDQQNESTSTGIRQNIQRTTFSKNLAMPKTSNKHSVLSKKSRATGTIQDKPRVKSNYSQRQQQTARNRPKSQLEGSKQARGENSSQDHQYQGPSGMSPDSQIHGGVADIESGLQMDSFGNKKFTRVMLQSFQEQMVPTSPMQMKDDDQQADYTTVHQNERKMPYDDSYNQNRGSLVYSQRKLLTPEGVHEEHDQFITNNVRQRPTTVRDTSKDYSRSSRRSARKQKVNNDSRFEHIPKYNENSLGEDIYSSETDNNQNKKLSLEALKPIVGALNSSSVSPTHRKNYSGSYQFDIGKELITNLSPDHERNKSSATHGGLVVGSNGSNTEDLSKVMGAGSGAQGAFMAQEAQNKKRLTMVNEQDQEHNMNKESSSRVSEFNLKQKLMMSANRSQKSGIMRSPTNRSKIYLADVANAVIEENNNFLAVNAQVSKGSSSRMSRVSRSSRRSRRQNHGQTLTEGHQIEPVDPRMREAIKKQESFGTSDDSSSDYNSHHVASARRTYQPNAQGGSNQIMNVQDNFKDGAGKQRPQTTVHQGSKIQRLLLEGLINEEQFICLQLLEKGYTPAAPNQQIQPGYSPDPSPRIRSRMGSMDRFTEVDQQRQFGQTYSQLKTHTSGFNTKTNRPGGMSSSASRSPTSGGTRMRSSRRVSKGFIKNTYKIYTNKMQVLEKIFDRVYAEKRNKGTQYTPPLIEADDQEADAPQQTDIYLQTRFGSHDANREMPVTQSAQGVSHLKQRSKKALIVRQARTLASTRQSLKAMQHHRIGYLSTQQFASQHHLGGTMSVGAKHGRAGSPHLEAKGIQARYHNLPTIQSQQNLKVPQKEKTSARQAWANSISTRQVFTGGSKKPSTNRIRLKKSAQQSRMLTSLGGTARENAIANMIQSASNINNQQPQYSYPDRLTNVGYLTHNLIVPTSGGQRGAENVGRHSAQSIYSAKKQDFL